MMESGSAPASAEIEPVIAPSDYAVAQPPFYVVSARKFLLLTLGTVGFYKVYWFYKNWQLQKRATGDSIWPAARAVFSIFFVHGLFKRVDKKLDAVAREYRWAPDSVALGYVIFAIAANVLDRLAGENIFSPYSDVAGTVTLFIYSALLYQAQLAINHASGDASGSTNDRLTAANYAWLVAGAALWLLLLIGLYAAIWRPELLETT
jgi:hypothetical protein